MSSLSFALFFVLPIYVCALVERAQMPNIQLVEYLRNASKTGSKTIATTVEKIWSNYVEVCNRDVLSKNCHKFQNILSSRNICSFNVKFIMMVAFALL